MPSTVQEAPMPMPVVEVPTPTAKPKASMPTPVVEVPTPTTEPEAPTPTPVVEVPTPTTEPKAPTPTTEQEVPMPSTVQEAPMPSTVTFQCQAPILPDTLQFQVRPKNSVTSVTPQQGDMPPRQPAGLTTPRHVSPRPPGVKSFQAPVQGANSNVSKAAVPSTASKPARSGPQTPVLKGQIIFNDKFKRVPSNDPSQRRLHYLSRAQLRARERRGPHNSKRGRPPRHPDPGRRMTNHVLERLHRPEDSLLLRGQRQDRLLCRDHLRPDAQG